MSPSIVNENEAIDENNLVVDCDLHVYPNEADDVIERLPDRFQSKGFVAPEGNWSSPIGLFRDDVSPDGQSLKSNPEVMCRHHITNGGIDRAIITGGRTNLRTSAQPDRRYAAALTSAYNDWLIQEWLEVDDRFLGSISVAPVEAESAAEEIRRLGDRQDMVQVVMGGGTQIALGQERYWPIYEAAVEKNLPVAIHVGAEGYGLAHANTGAGYPSTYLEAQSVIPANCMGQLLNLVLEGAFVKFPDLRVVIVGGGYSWIPFFLWRIDKMWKGLTDDMPWVEQPPSEYVREQMRFVVSTIDEQGDPERMNQMLEMTHGEEILMFGSNFPHWNSFSISDDLPELSNDLQRAIFSETAMTLYGLN